MQRSQWSKGNWILDCWCLQWEKNKAAGKSHPWICFSTNGAALTAAVPRARCLQLWCKGWQAAVSPTSLPPILYPGTWIFWFMACTVGNWVAEPPLQLDVIAGVVSLVRRGTCCLFSHSGMTITSLFFCEAQRYLTSPADQINRQLAASYSPHFRAEDGNKERFPAIPHRIPSHGWLQTSQLLTLQPCWLVSLFLV